MIREIRQFFHGLETLAVNEEGKPTRKDLQLATAILLIDLARGSSDYTQDEARTILLSLEKEFSLTRDQTNKLIEEAEASRRGQGRIQQFVDIIARDFDDSQKQIILAMVWRVIEADGLVEKYESAFAARLRTNLGLSLEQAVRARKLGTSEADLTLEEAESLTVTRLDE